MPEQMSAHAAGAPPEAAVIRCRDLAAMVAFYRDVIGLELAAEDPAAEGPESAVALATGPGFAPPRRVVLMAGEDAGEEDEPPLALHRLTLTVGDAEALARAEAWLRARGCALRAAEDGATGWKCLTVTDPEGNAVELAAPVRQRTIPASGGG